MKKLYQSLGGWPDKFRAYRLIDAETGRVLRYDVIDLSTHTKFSSETAQDMYKHLWATYQLNCGDSTFGSPPTKFTQCALCGKYIGEGGAWHDKHFPGEDICCECIHHEVDKLYDEEEFCWMLRNGDFGTPPWD